jgi:hypothetical protein
MNVNWWNVLIKIAKKNLIELFVLFALVKSLFKMVGMKWVRKLNAKIVIIFSGKFFVHRVVK